MLSCSPDRYCTYRLDSLTQLVNNLISLLHFILKKTSCVRCTLNYSTHFPNYLYRLLTSLNACPEDTLNVQSEGGEANIEPSVHLTVGVDTHIWGLNFASLRDSSMKKSGLADKILLTKLDEKLYWNLQVRLSFSRQVNCGE